MTKCFDLALFVGVPINVNDAVLATDLGPPFATTFKPVALSAKAGGVTVANDVPAATKAGQIMISGAGAGFPWSLIDNPAAAAVVPAPTAQYQVLMADATPSWQITTPDVILARGNAVTTTVGGTFVSAAKLTFSVAATMQTRLDGTNPDLSLIDNVTLDAGQF
jgi:hypothetical protein